MNQIRRKNKLKGYFENLEGRTQKSRERNKRRKKKKTTDTKLEVSKPHISPRE